MADKEKVTIFQNEIIELLDRYLSDTLENPYDDKLVQQIMTYYNRMKIIYTNYDIENDSDTDNDAYFKQ